jgi:PAT family beta-lactamase induction signal transducer AmpG
MYISKTQKMALILMLGFSCGIPLPLTLSTLSAYLFDYGFDISMIGLFGLTGIPYSLKPIWSPFLDNIKPPLLHKLGKRRGWLVIVQVMLILNIMMLGQFNPMEYKYLIGILALSVGFMSASQDIIVDALRVETLKEDEQGIGVAWYTIGYRFGMVAATAGALYIAEFFDWKTSFLCLSMLSSLGIMAALLMKEPKHPKVVTNSISEWLNHAFIKPFMEFSERSNWFLILLFVGLYRICDAYLGMMTSPFLLEIGFSKAEIANIVKLYGVAATLIGTFAGGYFVKCCNIHSALIYGGLIAALSNLAFIFQYYAGYDKLVLIGVITAENFASGFTSAIFIAYLGIVCNKEFTATQFALLSSLASVGRSTLSSSAGFLAKSIGWVNFFIFTAVLCLPAIVLIKFINHKQGKAWKSNSKNSKALSNQ